jgi:hypothetical protein
MQNLSAPPQTIRFGVVTANPMNISRIRTICSLLLGTTGLLLLAQVRAQDPAQSNLGVYGKTSTYCGAEAIPRNSPIIPEIGCFYLSPGHRATRTFSTHRVEVSVDSAGVEVFKVDGALVMEARDTASGTKLPYVGASGAAGYRFCEGPTDRNTGCPATITIFSSDSDKTVLFIVSECLPPTYRVCVTTQENWNYEKSRLH